MENCVQPSDKQNAKDKRSANNCTPLHINIYLYKQNHIFVSIISIENIKTIIYKKFQG